MYVYTIVVPTEWNGNRVHLKVHIHMKIYVCVRMYNVHISCACRCLSLLDMQQGVAMLQVHWGIYCVDVPTKDCTNVYSKQ